jgi:hypothetical protein
MHCDLADVPKAFLRPNLADPEHPDLKRSIVDNQTDYELLERDTSPFIPDSLLKYFHPNALGTIYQSGTVLDVLEGAFSDLNGISEDGCPIGGSPSNGDPNKEDLRCADVKVSPRAYIKRESMEAHATRFCEETAIKGAGTYQATYDKDVYNGAFIYIQTDHEISVSDCKMHLFQITNGCTPASNNPMNWKYGGELTVGTTLYKINIAGLATLRYTESDGAPLQKPVFYCAESEKNNILRFSVEGGGFANEANAQELYRKLQACYGSSINDWFFAQYGQPVNLGREWRVGGHVPGPGSRACLGQVLTQMIGYNANCDPEGVGFTVPW